MGLGERREGQRWHERRLTERGSLHRRGRVAVVMAICLPPFFFALGAGGADAAPVADVAGTVHNLSVEGAGSVRSNDATEVCVFCHTPHGATTAPNAPLWNRALSNSLYTPYSSSSLDAERLGGPLDQPGGSAKLCLSCHDGTLALGTVNVLGGESSVSLSMEGVAADGTMPSGAGANTGFTRDLGVDLTNDHPISLDYDTALAEADGELRDPLSAAHIGIRSGGRRPSVPLEPSGPGGGAQLQCTSCHDPHVRDTDPSRNIKFLRLNRFQETPPVDGAFDEGGDIVCLGCHEKSGWAASAHASASVANETYLAAGAAMREFPPALPVWQAACLNCHDTHAVSGSRRLLREGTDSPASPKSGGASAIEETCYQCHGNAPVISNAANEVPDIESEFALPRHMPLTSLDQTAGREVHDVGDADLAESPALLGKGNPDNRHAECTDCHNPHRVMKNSLFNGLGASRSGTHEPGGADGNIASGVLRGTWGVEPVYGGTDFLSLPSSYLIKEGDGGMAAGSDVGSGHVTREYQVCLKCHSDFGYDDTGSYPFGARPDLGDSGGGTPRGTNGLEQYTNQAMEFQAPFTDRGEPGGNHRSWHPVIGATERTPAVRGASASAWLAPWNDAVGRQTMYCSDCHGANTTGASIEPPGGENGVPWGPHGSSNDFLLKGSWNAGTGGNSREVPATDPANGLCFKCHDYRTYADRDGDDRAASGFSGEKSENLHAHHADKVEKLHCSWCHAAVPHGWKNKALLVNLNDVGPEAGLPAGSEVSIASSAQSYTAGPYYLNAKLKVLTFATSGNWEESNCGSASGQGGMGKDWMETVCENPP